jgi:hypothetical protein
MTYTRSTSGKACPSDIELFNNGRIQGKRDSCEVITEEEYSRK